APSRVLSIGAAPGGLVPLGSLRLALLRSFGDVPSVGAGIGALARPAGPPLMRVAAGELVPASELWPVLGALLGAYGARGRPWIVLSPLSLVDSATLAALLRAREKGTDFVLFGRFPVDEPLPRPLASLGEAVQEVTLPALRTSDGRVVAQAVLGAETNYEVALRVAVLGGDTVLGVLEAARALIAAGELVLEGDAFVWRTRPNTGTQAIGIEQLFAERLALLDPNSRRVLEALCVLPDGSPRDLLAAVSELDGVGAHGLELSSSLLEREALALGGPRPRPASSLLRWRVLSLTPPARSMELHRFVAAVLARERGTSPVHDAELGYYLCEGGQENDGRALIENVIGDVARAGYDRAARHLAALAARFGGREVRDSAFPPAAAAFDEEPPSVELPLADVWDEREQARLDAAAPAVLPAVLPAMPPAALPAVRPGALPTVPPPRPSVERPEAPRSPAEDVVHALMARDFDRLERAIQRAIAEGSDRGAVDRVRAVAELARGDLESARAHLRRARRIGKDDVAARSRYFLAEALLELRGGEAVAGVRAGLAALACSRELGDARGEKAALRALAACYRAMGREQQALRLEA
ncbi:MAG: hypothetical protein IT378_18520, partial [Sandaracinaceae bacterium]|nr:hypothetical protein [Sandaracinaceae bacterium]